MSEGPSTAGIVAALLICASQAGCGAPSNQAGCAFSEPLAEELLQGRLEHLEIVDAETGEVATYDNLGNPVLEGGQPLALWAEFDTPTQVELCVEEIDGRARPLHRSELTFSDEVVTQPLGRYDLGSYLLYLSIDGTLAATIEFDVR